MVHEALVVAKLITMTLGFVIAYQAYHGYRRSESRPMLFVAIGFCFVSFGAVSEGLPFEVVGLSIFLAGAVQTGLVAIGMLFVLYSPYGRHRPSTS